MTLDAQCAERDHIFISYRRDDARGTSGRLYDWLRIGFGRERVFRDVQSIGVGKWRNKIDAALARSSVCVVVIGPRWANADNLPRLHDESDMVRHEIVTALVSEELTLVPTLVEGAEVRKVAVLPIALQPLFAVWNARRATEDGWEDDTRRLITEIADAGRLQDRVPFVESGRHSRRLHRRRFERPSLLRLVRQLELRKRLGAIRSCARVERRVAVRLLGRCRDHVAHQLSRRGRKHLESHAHGRGMAAPRAACLSRLDLRSQRRARFPRATSSATTGPCTWMTRMRARYSSLSREEGKGPLRIPSYTVVSGRSQYTFSGSPRFALTSRKFD
jgi:hypothetical protein